MACRLTIWTPKEKSDIYGVLWRFIREAISGNGFMRNSIEMELRKLQRTGGSSYALSLPKQWVKAVGLHKGDSVFLEWLSDGTMAVSGKPFAPKGERRKVIEVKEEERDEHLLRKLIGSYILGYDIIEVHSAPEELPMARKVIRNFTRMTIGPEIVEETKKSITTQDLSDLSDLSVEKCLRRMHMTARSMHEFAIEAVAAGSEESAKEVMRKDEDIDRLYWMVARQYGLSRLNRSLTMTDATRVGMYDASLVARLLERIGDHAAKIAGAAVVIGGKVDRRLTKELEDVSRSALEILDVAFASYLAADVDSANAIIDKAPRLEKTVEDLAHRCARHEGEELLALGIITDSISRTSGYSTDIAEIAINRAMFGEEDAGSGS